MNRAKGRIPPASAAEFVPAAAPAAAVGHLVLAPAVLDPEDAAANAAAAQAAAAAALPLRPLLSFVCAEAHAEARGLPAEHAPEIPPAAGAERG